MILIAVVVLSILLGPPCIGIFLPLLLFALIFWNPSLLDSLVLFQTISLLRYKDDLGIYSRSLIMGGLVIFILVTDKNNIFPSVRNTR
jgi:hypothetical protein